MTSPNIPFERVDHFRSRLKVGDEDTTISRAHIGDAKIYIAHTPNANLGEEAAQGYLLIRESQDRREVLHYKVPESRPEDPLAAKRTLALLAFSALLEDQKAHRWTEETLLTVAVEDSEAHPDPLLRDVLGVRMRRTGRIHAGRPQNALVRAAISEAMGSVNETLSEVQSYRAPYPGGAGPLPWMDAERNGVA